VNAAPHPRTRVAEALYRYRERLGDPKAAAVNPLPDYGDRGSAGFLSDGFVPTTNTYETVRGERGVASVGELMLLRRAGKAGKVATAPGSGTFTYNCPATAVAVLANNSYRCDFPALTERDAADLVCGAPPAGSALFAGANATVSNTAQVSIDVNHDILSGVTTPDVVSEDSEEANLLLAGAANILTTRSDTFTVYFKVRSFRQHPVTGVWDATDPENIVDEARYVMLVDRSQVNRPGDKPKILYLEKLPK
jgi:hypothetical protein